METIYCVGIGPGGRQQMTFAAWDALSAAEVIVGYASYTALLMPLLPEKTYLSAPMGQERERCLLAFSEARRGRRTAVVCSGDAGVYGMAGLLFEMKERVCPGADIRVIPGVTAALSGAALLGAPLMGDFAVISLSDYLVTWEQITARLTAAAAADLVIVLYNPASRARPDCLRKACEIISEAVGGEERVCGAVSNIGRAGESFRILTLSGLAAAGADMVTTVFIGNSATKEMGGRMVTPRGYRL